MFKPFGDTDAGNLVEAELFSDLAFFLLKLLATWDPS